MTYRPTILAEEFYPGYWWELQRMNSEVKARTNLLAFTKNTLARHRFEVPAVASLAGISLEQLIKDHSLTHYREVGLRALDWTRQESGRDVLRHDSFKLPRVLRFCEECCEDDIGFHGRAYYRRSHQMPGVNWCRRHGFRKLLWTPSNQAGVMHSPDEWLRVLHEHPEVPRWEDLSISTQHYLSQFMASSEAAMKPGYSIDVDVMRSRWGRLKIRTSMQSDSVLIRSLSLKDHPGFDGLEIPYDWLDNNFRYWESTLPVEPSNRVLTALTSSWLLMTTLTGDFGSMHSDEGRPLPAHPPSQMSRPGSAA